MESYPYLNRLGSLLAADIIITVIISYIPHEFTPLRILLSVVQLGFMVITMALAIRYVLEDF